MGDALRLSEDGGQSLVITRRYTRNLTSIHILLILQIDGIIDRSQRHVVEHLSRLHHKVLSAIGQVVLPGLHLLHRHHCLAALLHGEEINHRRGLEFIVDECLHRHLREEGEGTLTAHHRVGDDIERIIISHQRTEVQSRHVLNTIFGTYARGQGFVGTYLVAQGLDLLQEFGMTLAEGVLTIFRTSIEYGAVSQDDSGADHHTVAVGMHTAVHTRGIVDHYTAHHRRTDGSRVGWKHASVGL